MHLFHMHAWGCCLIKSLSPKGGRHKTHVEVESNSNMHKRSYHVTCMSLLLWLHPIPHLDPFFHFAFILFCWHAVIND